LFRISCFGFRVFTASAIKFSLKSPPDYGIIPAELTDARQPGKEGQGNVEAKSKSRFIGAYPKSKIPKGPNIAIAPIPEFHISLANLHIPILPILSNTNHLRLFVPSW
jgi:hypothetical protein